MSGGRWRSSGASLRETDLNVDIRAYLISKGVMVKGQSGGNLRTTCFFCNEEPNKRGRLYIGVDDERTAGLYLCHRCGARGNLVTLRRHFGDEDLAESDPVSRHTNVLAAAARFYARCRDTVAVEYLHQDRALSDATIERHEIGFAPGGRSLYEELRKDFSPADILETGLVVKRNREFVDFLQAGQITIPYHINGMVVAIRGKEIGGKYLTPPGTKARLFNVDVVPRAEELVLAEGEFDALVLEQLGYAALGVPGANVFQEHWVDYFTDARRVYIAFDPDEAGHAGTERVLGLLGPKAKRVDLPVPEGVAPKDIDPSYLVAQERWGRDNFDALFSAALGSSTLLVTVNEAYLEWGDLQNASGLRLGFPLLDRAIKPGLLPGQVVVPLAKTNSGKATKYTESVPTPEGFRLVGDLDIGDEVFGVDGLPTEVIGVFPQGRRPLYRVTFSDRSHLDCSGDHLWEIQFQAGGTWQSAVMTTLEILAVPRWRRRKWQIPIMAAVQYDHRADLEVDPYLMGTLLAIDDLSASRRIPEKYLLGSIPQRRALLQGILDGALVSRQAANVVAVRTDSLELAEDLASLVCSLGGTATIERLDRSGRNSRQFRVSLSTPDDIVLLGRRTHGRHQVPTRRITSIEPVGEEDCVCIAVNNIRGLYVVGRRYLTTHNTLLLLSFMQRASMVPGQEASRFLFVSLEQTRSEWFERARRQWFFYHPCEPARNALAWERVGDQGRQALHRWIDEGTLAYWTDRLWIVDQNRLTEDHLNAAIEEFQENTGAAPNLVLVDYLGYWAASAPGTSRYEKVSNAVMSLKAVAKAWRVPIIAPHQVSRGAEFGTEFAIDQGRDSVTGDTRVLLADGRWERIDSLVGKTPVVFTMTGDQRLTTRQALKVWNKGRREVITVATSSGRRFSATPEHPVFGEDGKWVHVEDLHLGDRIAVPPMGTIRRLRELHDSRVAFDDIVAIFPAGEADVYDMTVPGTHCFVGEFVYANSGAVEETADFVFSLWNADDTRGNQVRAGQLNLKIGKSRHGGKPSQFSLQMGYLSLVIVPREDKVCEARAAVEADWVQHGVPWDEAIYHHHLGLRPDVRLPGGQLPGTEF